MDLDPALLRHADDQDSSWDDAYFVYGGPFRLFWLAGLLAAVTGTVVAARDGMSVEGVALVALGVLVLAANRHSPAGRDHVWWHTPRHGLRERLQKAAAVQEARGGTAEDGTPP